MAKMLVNGITIAYDDAGKGDNVLVLVHGHPFDRTMWRPQVECIGRARPEWRVILPDLRGYGESDEDAFTTRIDAEQMCGFSKRSELVWIEGVGHLPNLEREEELPESCRGRMPRYHARSGNPKRSKGCPAPSESGLV
jgi:pimeloyl-ACP methyl ester carboxylesterase